jgi:hypothetical protein
MTSVSRIGRAWALALLLLGACGGSDSGNGGSPDATVDASLDSSADLAADRSADLAALDTAADVTPIPPDAGPDGSSCLPPATISYSAPGCGMNARPNCGGPALDACALLTFYCGCDGKTTVTGGCNWSNEPYLYAGPCRDGGAADGP